MLNFKACFTSEQAHFLKDTKGHHPISNFAIHPKQDAMMMVSILDMPDRNNAATWTFQLYYSSMTENNDELLAMNSQHRLSLLKDRAQSWVEPWKSAMTWVPDGTDIPADISTYWANPVKWDNRGGRITLAGDSAHPIPPCKSAPVNV
jgi:2-polyprenyl-6-methoxyphenol hydroxylase-like FAD-dependent oxidoreductase